MKKKLIKILKDAHEENAHEVESIAYIDGGSPLVVDGLTIYTAEQHGGEGQGDEYWCVMSVTDETGKESFWEVPGWYASYEGSTLEIENLFEVEAKEKVVTVWEAKE